MSDTDRVVLTPLDPADAARCGELEALLFDGDDPWPAAAFTRELDAPHNWYVAARAGGLLVRSAECGDETDDVKLLRVERLLANDQDAACDEHARLFGHAAHEGANLITLFSLFATLSAARL